MPFTPSVTPDSNPLGQLADALGALGANLSPNHEPDPLNNAYELEQAWQAEVAPAQPEALKRFAQLNSALVGAYHAGDMASMLKLGGLLRTYLPQGFAFQPAPPPPSGPFTLSQMVEAVANAAKAGDQESAWRMGQAVNDRLQAEHAYKLSQTTGGPQDPLEEMEMPAASWQELRQRWPRQSPSALSLGYTGSADQ